MSKRVAFSGALLVVVGLAVARADDGRNMNLAGSIQVDTMAIPTQDVGHRIALDGTTVELSVKLGIDFGPTTSANVKVCYACHGFEVGMAFFDIHVADALNFRAGRFTPSFGSFPLRHDPANHRTSDKPLPYDMGRMLRLREWGMSVLPAPWVDNGLEISGSLDVSRALQLAYAAYAIMGPKGPAGALDVDFIQSRTLYYTDNNSRPTLGARLAATVGSEPLTLWLGASAMGGDYDPENRLRFYILGADASLHLGGVALRAEYLVRRTQFDLGLDPASRLKYGPGPDGTFDDWFTKHGFYTELEVPVGRDLAFVARWDGMRRVGNVGKDSPLRSTSTILRYTAAMSYRFYRELRLKLSGELYDFSDFRDDVVIHLGLAGPF